MAAHLGRRRLLGLAAGFSTAALLAACGRGTPGPAGTSSRGTALAVNRITIGYLPNVTHAPALVAVARNSFNDALPGLAVEYRTFNAGPTLVEALFANAVDLGYVGPSPAVNGYAHSKGQALRIVGGAMSGGASFVVRPAAKVERPADLNGKKLASPQRGNTQDIALRTYLRAHGLKTTDQGGTVDVVPTSNPDIVNLFKQGQIDGAWVPEPWASTLVLQADGHVFVDERTLWPGGRFVTTNVVATAKLLTERPDVVRAFLTAHVEAVEYVTGDANSAKKVVGEQIAKLTAQPIPPDVLDRAFSTQDATYDPLAKTVLVQAENAFALGFLGERVSVPDLSGLLDTALLNEVLGAAGKPPVGTA